MPVAKIPHQASNLRKDETMTRKELEDKIEELESELEACADGRSSAEENAQYEQALAEDAADQYNELKEQAAQFIRAFNELSELVGE